MPNILAHILSYLATPIAALWVGHHEVIIRVKGRPLTPQEKIHCQSLGIQHPEHIRILEVPRVPSGLPPYIENLLQKLNYPAGNAAGMCMRYGIYIQKKYAKNPNLLNHELVHTAQYEQLGSINTFLQKYLHQCLHHGYQNAPLEIQARNLS